MIPDPAVFLFRYLSHETRDGDTGSGNILAHEADGGAERKVIFDPGKKFHAFPGETGKNQMADENTAEQDAVFRKPVRPGDTAHFTDGGGGSLEIIRGFGAQLSGAGGIMLQVRQKDIHRAFQHMQGFHGFIAGGVPDDRERRTPELQRVQDPRNKGRAGDQGQRLNTQIREAFQRVGKLAGSEGSPRAGMRDFAVLAVNTTESATGKKDGPGAPGSGDRRFLPQMGCDPGNVHFFAKAAETGGYRAVGTALPGTQGTDHGGPPFCWGYYIPKRGLCIPVVSSLYGRGVFRYNIFVKILIFQRKGDEAF